MRKYCALALLGVICMAGTSVAQNPSVQATTETISIPQWEEYFPAKKRGIPYKTWCEESELKKIYQEVRFQNYWGRLNFIYNSLLILCPNSNSLSGYEAMRKNMQEERENLPKALAHLQQGVDALKEIDRIKLRMQQMVQLGSGPPAGRQSETEILCP